MLNYPQKGNGKRAVERSDGRVYPSIAEAVRSLAVEKGFCDMGTPMRISRACRDSRKTVHGYHWKWWRIDA